MQIKTIRNGWIVDCGYRQDLIGQFGRNSVEIFCATKDEVTAVIAEHLLSHDEELVKRQEAHEKHMKERANEIAQYAPQAMGLVGAAIQGN